ncbi:MAG: porin [Vicingaceae bacterium]
MKAAKLIYFFLLVAFMATPTLLRAQNPQLNKYDFGEGIDFGKKGEYEMNFRGYMQPYTEVKNYTTNDKTDNLTRFRLRRLRLRLTGEASKYKVDYRFQVDLSGSSEVEDETNNNYLLDAWVRYALTNRTSITFGQRATPTDNRELYMGSNTLQLPERSRVTSAFASIREFGFFAESSARFNNGSYIKSYLTLTNGDGLNAYNSDFGGLKVGGRIDYLPFGLFTKFGQYRQADVVREISPKLVIGGNFSVNQGMSSRRGRGSGEILYLDEEGDFLLPNYTKYGIDFMFKYKGFSVLGEFMASEASVPEGIKQRVRNDGSTSSTFDVDGEQDVANYIKGRMMLGKGYNIQAGYLFKSLYSIDARFTYLDADKHSFLNNGTFYNRPRYYTAGVSKYFDRSYGAKIQASFTYVDAGEGGINDINSNPIKGNEWIARLITTLSF